ncbi:MAG: efflux RND transporter periplasmic adaptor subunit [Woeseiaceae bacterium]|nr:efflux RND transporter periplasmic adaptor subunit [Woeseiaceae bacterium]NIP19940.1 efflux RND transporter periplasmic adaptor subunit [Woeseiaceae bacterium]NIS88741.1 efflux RND transporter periplasmic adaptor subunit [Woeseiaceae bacterium]
MQGKGIRALLITGIIVSAVFVSIALSALREAPAKKEAAPRDLLVEVMVVEPMTANFEIGSQGTVRPRIETVLSAEVAGTIVEISPKWTAGGVFRPGEVLMRIDPTNYRVAVKQAEALVKQRQIEFDGAEKLLSQGYRAEAEHASAAAALASAAAELVRANRNLERTDIQLPYSGMVRSKEADLGQFVNPGTRLGVVFATDQAEVRLPLTDEDLDFLNLPSAVDIRATGSGAGPMVELAAVRRGKVRTWNAQVVRTEGVVDENSRVTYAVAVIEDPYRLESAGEVLPVGTFVSAQISGTSREGIFRLPRSALKGADELLIADESDQLEIRSVDIVRSDAEDAYIEGGLAAGDRVILTAVESPVNGMRLRPIVVGK